MNRYYCPFCSPSNQSQKYRSDGVLICVHCGDPLLRKSFFNLRQLFGFILIFAFFTPFLFMMFFIINDINENNNPLDYESLTLLAFAK